jgi:hypothetical protein
MLVMENLVHFTNSCVFTLSDQLSVFMQVGIIMYLPTSDARQRKEITEEFFNYRRLTQTGLWGDYSAYEHWAKIEVPILAVIHAYMMLHSFVGFGIPSTYGQIATSDLKISKE